MANNTCFQIINETGKRINEIFEPGSFPGDRKNIKLVIQAFDLIFSYIDESIYAEFDHIAKSVHTYRDNSGNKATLGSASIDITDEYVTYLRNEVVTKFHKHWAEVKSIAPGSIFGIPLFLLTKKGEVTRLTMKIINSLNEACFWAPFLIPILDEAMNLNMHTDPPRNFVATDVENILKGPNRRLTFHEAQAISMSLADLKTDMAIKYFHHARRVWEERKLREAFETAFKATGFTNVMERYIVTKPTYPADPPPQQPDVTQDSDTDSQTSSSRLAAIRNNFTFNIKLGGETKMEVESVEAPVDSIRVAEDVLLSKRNFQWEWNKFARYMDQFQAFAQPK